MLSTQTLSNVDQADKYFYEREEYFRKEGVLFEQPSQWWGKGAEKLGLNGDVDRGMFRQLLSGLLPSGQQLGKKEDDEIKHRPGFDLTFSVPKSWSILHWVTEDLIFTELADKAVNTVLGLIEQECAMAKTMANGEQVTTLTDNLVVAKHYHRLSRELEMQDHIHCIVMNMTERPDGKWRSLASQSPDKPHHTFAEGFIERVRSRKLDLGAIYRMELARLAIDHGFPIRRTGETYWELDGIPQEIIVEFSTRSAQKRADMEKRGVKGALQAAKSILRTRKSKDNNITKQDIETALAARLAKFPFDFKSYYESIDKKKVNNILSMTPESTCQSQLRMPSDMPSSFTVKANHHYHALNY